jgi:Flp pilus assembly protein TadG
MNVQRRRGSTVVELGLTVAIFLTLIFGVIDFSAAIYAYDFVGHAAQEAARYAIVNGAGSAKPASATDVQNYVSGLVTSGLNTKLVTVSTTWLPDNKPGSVVTVKVSYNFSPLTPLVPSAMVTLTRTAAMVISR